MIALIVRDQNGWAVEVYQSDHKCEERYYKLSRLLGSDNPIPEFEVGAFFHAPSHTESVYITDDVQFK